jgi:hypothetical protein
MLAAATATSNAVEPATSEKQALAWNRYEKYLLSISITADPYLNNFTKSQ